MQTQKIPYFLAMIFLTSVAVLLISFMFTEAQTTNSTLRQDDTAGTSSSQTVDTIAAYPSSGTTPAPMVIEGDSLGNVLIRGTVESIDVDSLTMSSWGGTWTVRTDGLTAVIPQAMSGIPGDLSAISIGDFIGVDGTMAQDQDFTVDATLVRDWTTNPFNGAPFSAPAEEEPSPNGVSATSAPDSRSMLPVTTPSSFSDDSITDDGSDATTATEAMDSTPDESDVTYSGPVDSIDTDANSFTFTDDFDSTYTVFIDQNTAVVNNDDEVIGLEDVAEGDRVEVEGTVNSNTINASLVRNLDDSGGLFF